MNKLYVVGIGFPSLMNSMAQAAIDNADLIVGYTKYVDEIKGMLAHQQTYSTGMRAERQRIEHAIGEAAKGRKVCVVCSGDPSLYGMSSLAYELAEGSGVEIEVIPSVTAAMAVSAKLGSPISNDLVILSMSDLLTPWETIQKRIEAVNMADFVCAIYNPASKSRNQQLVYALNSFKEARGNLIVGSVRHAFRKDEAIQLSTIADFDLSSVDMFTLVIVGNTHTKIIDGKMVTPRGYDLQ